MLLFSVSKVAEIFFSQSGVELRIQDGVIGSDILSSSETWKPGRQVPIARRMNAGVRFGRAKR